MNFTTRPETQIEVENLVALLRQTSVGAILEYATASRAIGRNVQKEARPVMAKAIKTVEREAGIRFATVRAHGIKRLAGEDVAGIGSEARLRIGRVARKTFNRLSDLRYNDISDQARRKIDVERSLLGTISTLTDAATARKVDGQTGDMKTGPIPAAKLIEALRG